MKVAVCVKAVPDTVAGRRMDAASGRLDRRGELALSAFDLHAVEQALVLAEGRGAVEVVAVSLGPLAASDALRKALAMGADRSVLVSDERFEGADLLVTAAALAGALRREQPDLVLFGQQSADGEGACLGAAVAEQLGFPVISQVAALSLEGACVRGRRQTEFGYEQVSAPLPAVVAVSDAINEPRYPSLKGIMGAKSKPQELLSAADVGGAGLSRTTVLALAAPPLRGERRVVRDDGAAAEEILAFLAEKRLLLMRTLVFLEHHAREITKASLGVLSRAASLGGETAAVLAGADLAGLAEQAGRFGARTVYLAEDARLAAPLPQPRVEVLARLVAGEGFDTVLFAQSVLATDLAAALAVRLDAGLNWDLADVELRAGALVGRRPALSDSVWVDVGWSSPVRLALFRAGAFDPVESGGAAEVRELEVELDPRSLRAELVEAAAEESSGPSIEDAEVIVAGGRGLGSPAGFALVEELAEALGGAVAATRAVVDAGWYPYRTQVGQTGKTVSPRLYLAVGISGAIQHKVGMAGSGVIVAINKDPHAPIFEYADLGVVGDLNAIVPRLSALVRAARG